MLYPQNIEQKIGFDKIRQLLSEKCVSDLAREEIEKITFSTDFEAIVAQLRLVDEMMKLLADGQNVPFANTFDMRQAFANARIEGMFLEQALVAQLRSNLQNLQQVVTFFSHLDNERFASLHNLSNNVLVFPDLLRQIDAILDKFGEIKDSASPELLQIRREIHKAQNSVSRTLNSILKQAQVDGLVEKDATPTMRDGRLVIPILSMNKRKLGGIIHDESATGKTAYVEPTAVVEVNNRLRELEGDERREIIRILVQLTTIIRPYFPDILESTQFLVAVDALHAKAQFSIDLKAIKPHITNVPFVSWFDARHPLLQKSLEKQGKQIVPLNVSLNEKQRILLISGPNAGGKSVCLKTVGLLQYMLQCGLPIPVGERSKVGLFDSIFIDIGDEQSIENDLSTYSSHLLNMKNCLRYGNGKSLMLIDEFGTGTEPQIGGAIAESVLEKLNKQHVFALITTHYTNLKHFASNTEGIVNGAMLYDRHQMQPLFSLQIGSAGSSFAIDIARKVGLPEEVIQSATSKVGAEHIDYDKNLQDAARDKRYWEQKRQQVREKEKHLERQLQSFQQKNEELEKNKKKILNEAKAQATDIIAQANAQIEQTIREIKESNAQKGRTKDARHKLEAMKQTLVVEEKKNVAPQKVQHLEIGDHVQIVGQDLIGTIVEVNSKTAVVTFGDLKSTVALVKLQKISNQQVKNVQRASLTKNTTNALRERQLAFNPEIDVRGMRVDEAINAVMYFVDDAAMFGVNRIRILHGTGTGALRLAIRDYLHVSSVVKNYHDEHVQLGGAGITVVEL